jgi:glycosyltransferase involved in cell wall biosynthesis
MRHVSRHLLAILGCNVSQPGAPIRILRAITRLNIGGPTRHVIVLTRDLDDGVHFQSTLVTGTPTPHEGDMADVARASGIEPHVLPGLGREISPLDDLLALANMVRLIRATKPDVVHTHMAKAGTVGRLAAQICRVPLIVHTYHGHVFHSYFGPLKTRVFLTIERALGLGTQRIIVLGEGQRDEIAAFGVAPRSKLVPIPLGLELGQFLHAEHERGVFRAELGCSESTALVGIVARLVPIKAHEVFFEAAAHVRRQLEDVRFLVIGDGERRAELEQLVRQQGLSQHVHFLGWRSDLTHVFADLDVVTLASRNEGSPVSLIEAMAAARPVVATAVGGVPEVVLHGQTGLTVPSGDARALANGLIKVLNDPELAKQFGQAGRRHVYPRYDASRLVDDVRNLYVRELASRGRVVPSLGATAW